MKLDKVLSQGLNSLVKVSKKNSPIILAVLGVSGFISATVMSGEATIKARKSIANAENRKGCTLTKFETFKAAAPHYIPTALTVVASSGCIAGSVGICYRRHATLLAAYTLSENRFNEFYNKTVETIGEKKTRKMDKSIDDDKAKHVSGSDSSVSLNPGDVLARDFTFGREFSSNGNKIQAAKNKINAKLSKSSESYVSLNEAWDILGLRAADIGDSLGWNSADIGVDGIDILYNYTKGEDEQPFLWMRFDPLPKYGYSSY